jgi:tRNA(Leu) C34 or U34 (ribose-2'-O)-methylase TrmL
MKRLASYSEKKFLTLSPAGQAKALEKLLEALEESLADAFTAETLRTHILECVSWMGEPLPDNVSKLAEGLRHAQNPWQSGMAIQAYRTSLGRTFKDTQLGIVKGDGPRAQDAVALKRAQQMTLILDNLRSVFNIGSIFRCAECLSLKEILLCGVSATPDHPALKKTAMGTQDKVAWRYFTETADAIREARSAGCRIVALETAENAVSVFSAGFRIPLALVVGNESLGLPPDVLALCDEVVSLPVLGWKNSLNVAVATAVCAYQIVFGGE